MLSALSEILPTFGHRNWIAVVDAAYPAQSRAGIETIVVDADQTVVLEAVLADLDNSRHVRPIIYVDAELAYVLDADAPGVNAYRTSLADIVGSHKVNSLPHEEIIAKLDTAAETFNVVIFKTRMTIPYTSVFIQLDCKYWSDEAEKKLRASITRVS